MVKLTVLPKNDKSVASPKRGKIQSLRFEMVEESLRTRRSASLPELAAMPLFVFSRSASVWGINNYTLRSDKSVASPKRVTIARLSHLGGVNRHLCAFLFLRFSAGA